MIIEVENTAQMNAFGMRLAGLLGGGEVIELVGDVGAGKTTLTKALARGLGADEDVQSPSFTLSRQYPIRDDLTLVHYDFYRLADAGIMNAELEESVNDTHTITVIEWADIVSDVLPADRLTILIVPLGETSRRMTIQAHGPISQLIEDRL